MLRDETQLVILTGGNSQRYWIDEVLTGKASFLRIHQSYLVNRRAILSLDHVTHEALLSNGAKLPVSRSYYPGVLVSLSQSAWQVPHFEEGT